MKYERLTDSETAIMLKNTKGLSWSEDDIETQRYIRLAELEDKIEAGTLAEVGKLFIEYDEIGGGYLICNYGKQSKGVEFTREAAEKRLEELRGER